MLKIKNCKLIERQTIRKLYIAKLKKNTKTLPLNLLDALKAYIKFSNIILFM